MSVVSARITHIYLTYCVCVLFALCSFGLLLDFAEKDDGIFDIQITHIHNGNNNRSERER